MKLNPGCGRSVNLPLDKMCALVLKYNTPDLCFPARSLKLNWRALKLWGCSVMRSTATKPSRAKRMERSQTRSWPKGRSRYGQIRENGKCLCEAVMNQNQKKVNIYRVSIQSEFYRTEYVEWTYSLYWFHKLHSGASTVPLTIRCCANGTIAFWLIQVSVLKKKWTLGLCVGHFCLTSSWSVVTVGGLDFALTKCSRWRCSMVWELSWLFDQRRDFLAGQVGQNTVEW